MSKLTQRLREHNDERLYAEADILMCDAACEIDCLERAVNELAEINKQLLDALKAFPGFLCGTFAGDAWIEQMREAIARAEQQ